MNEVKMERNNNQQKKNVCLKPSYSIINFEFLFPSSQLAAHHNYNDYCL